MQYAYCVVYESQQGSVVSNRAAHFPGVTAVYT